jgi:hypothetical protein
MHSPLSGVSLSCELHRIRYLAPVRVNTKPFHPFSFVKTSRYLYSTLNPTWNRVRLLHQKYAAHNASLFYILNHTKVIRANGMMTFINREGKSPTHNISAKVLCHDKFSSKSIDMIDSLDNAENINSLNEPMKVISMTQGGSIHIDAIDVPKIHIDITAKWQDYCEFNDRNIISKISNDAKSNSCTVTLKPKISQETVNIPSNGNTSARHLSGEVWVFLKVPEIFNISINGNEVVARVNKKV